MSKLDVNLNPIVLLLITARIRRMGKVLFSHVSVCPHPRQGVPQSHVLFQVTGSRNFLGVYPTSQVLSQLSGPRSFPTPVLRGGTPVLAERYPLARTGLGYPPNRTVERALVTQRSVCLLDSGRRTFLLKYLFAPDSLCYVYRMFFRSHNNTPHHVYKNISQWRF